MADDFDPSKDSILLNGARLYKHVLTKGFQFGSLIGLVIIGPAVTAVQAKKGGKESLTVAELGPKLAKAQVISAAAGLGLSAVMGTIRVARYEDKKDALEQRAYRLHYNKSQSRADLFSQAGMALGGIGAAALLGPTALAVVGGASAGAALGVLGHVATSKGAMKSPEGMGKEL